jgi:hypothetical protein
VQRARAMLMMWRTWLLRNDAIFGTGREMITGSVNFLVIYHATLSGLCTKGSKETDVKGKTLIDNPSREDRAGRVRAQIRRQKEVWKPPRAGWVKLNTDAGFCRDTGAASAGIVVRDHAGLVLLTA